MKTPHNIQTSLDDEISIADMIDFFKSHKKMILIFVIIGTILGGLFAYFKEPSYKGSLLISTSKVFASLDANPKFNVANLGINSKEVLLKCNPNFYKDKDKDKDIDYDIASIVKVSNAKNGSLIELSMQDKNKIAIYDCLNSMADHILTIQNKSIEPLLELKENGLKIAKEKLKEAEEFKTKLNSRQINELKLSDKGFAVDLLYSNMILFNAKDIKEIKTEINTIKIDLFEGKMQLAYKVTPVRIEKKLPLKQQLGARIGLFLGLCLGILIALIKQMKI
jgi:capsular polysaccharide biosynthesis protein